MYTSVRRIYGVDFSGGDKAYKKIWITEAAIEDDKLTVNSCSPGSELPGKPRQRDNVIDTLRRFIEERPNAAFGLDFPFGLPRPIANASSWEEFISRFPERFSGAKEFYESCKVAGRNLDGDGIEYYRLTEKETDAPFCSYNLWMYKQTYYGITRLLYPFVIEDTACVLPMQSPDDAKPWVMEICPSSTLRSLGLRRDRYKGPEEERVAGRQELLQDLSNHGIKFSEVVAETLLKDDEGDALDSIVAAFAVYRTLQTSENQIIEEPLDEPYSIEGYIFE